MKTLRKNTLARVIGIGLAIGLASPVIARDAPQQQQEDAHHDQDKDKGKHQASSLNASLTALKTSHRPMTRMRMAIQLMPAS